jgi:Ras-related protein Rab-11A
VANKLLFIETSALDATNVTAAFEELLENIYNIVASKAPSLNVDKSNMKLSGRTSLILPHELQKKDSTGCC